MTGEEVGKTGLGMRLSGRCGLPVWSRSILLPLPVLALPLFLLRTTWSLPLPLLLFASIMLFLLLSRSLAGDDLALDDEETDAAAVVDFLLGVAGGDGVDFRAHTSPNWKSEGNCTGKLLFANFFFLFHQIAHPYLMFLYAVAFPLLWTPELVSAFLQKALIRSVFPAKELFPVKRKLNFYFYER